MLLQSQVVQELYIHTCYCYLYTFATILRQISQEMSTEDWCSGYHGWVSVMCNALVTHLSWLLAEVYRLENTFVNQVNRVLAEIDHPWSTLILTLVVTFFLVTLSFAICLVLTNLVLMCIRSLLRISIWIVMVATLLIAATTIATYVLTRL